MAALYELKNLRRVFGGREVLHIPALTLEAGLIYGLLGPNGAGKTTLMRLLAFMDQPNEGEIVFQGRAMTPELGARNRGTVVWVSQSPVMFTGTLLYNVEYPMRLKGVPRAQRSERAMALLETVGLARLAAAPARRLSGGEAQRASIARALAAGAQVILFDEPTASVDVHSRGELIRIIRDLWREQGLSVIVTTHDFDLAAQLCREQISLFDGKLVSPRPVPMESSPLPQGLSARPGRLFVLGEGFGVTGAQAGPDARERLQKGGGQQAVLTGLGKSPGGVTLRLIPVQRDAAALDILLTAEEDGALARQLTLDSSIKVLL